MNKKSTGIFSKTFIAIGLLVVHAASAQRVKIDSLRNELVKLKDTARIDCLNTLSLIYTYLQEDTASYFAQKAFNDAHAIGYTRGTVMSLNNKAHIAGIARNDFPLQEKISLQTLREYPNLIDKKILAACYLNLALAQFCQSNFDHAAKACNEALSLANISNDKKLIGEANAMLGSISFETGQYQRAFELFNAGLSVFKSIPDVYNTAILLAKMGDLYRLSMDDSTALDFYRQSLRYPEGSTLTWYPLADLGDTYYSMERYDSAAYDLGKYLQAMKSLTVRSNYKVYPKILQAEAAIASGQFDKALVQLKKDLELSHANNDRNKSMRILSDIARAYDGKKDYGHAFEYTRALLNEASMLDARQYLRDGYQQLNKLFDHQGNIDSAYVYQKKYVAMKDAVALSELTRVMAISKAVTDNQKKEAQLSLLTNEKKINDQQLALNADQLSYESFIRKIMVGGVISMLILGLVVFRNIRLKQKNESVLREMAEKELNLQRLESERISMEWQQRTTELEMQALRAQMNPHFIFNCLNSINRFTQTNEPAKAADYLTKFAKLIRIILQQSGKSFIPLEDELFALRLYMELEALRFEIPFQYKIQIGQTDPAAVWVPPLLLQPFVENAIWHGLHPKEKKDGIICIDFSNQGDFLLCKIRDNGVGRTVGAKKNPEEINGKESLGIKLTQHRLELFESTNGNAQAVIDIEDLKNDEGQPSGTCVQVKIPMKSA